MCWTWLFSQLLLLCCRDPLGKKLDNSKTRKEIGWEPRLTFYSGRGLTVMCTKLEIGTLVEQLHIIFKLCGTPSEEYWKKLKVSTTFRPPHVYKPNLREVFRDLPKCSLGLLKNLLSLDPSLRGSANSALKNETTGL